MGLAGFAQVDMGVDEAGADDEVCGVDAVGFFFFFGAKGGGDFAVFYKEVADGVAVIGRIDDVAVAYPEIVM